MTAKRLFLKLAAAAFCVGAIGSSFAQTVAPPEGKVAINYSRCDNNYDSWGLHAWSGSTPIPGVSWAAPMPPTGKNDFGVYWHVDLSAFGSSGTVNYIIHKADTKEQGGKDQFFEGKTTKEVWVNSGERKTYTSLDDAKKAREASPCK